MKSMEPVNPWGDAFKENYRIQLGRGNRYNFWNDVWVGNGNLKTRFPRIYGLAMKKDGKISEFGNWNGSNWVWYVELRRKPMAWELHYETLNAVHLGDIQNDCIRWNDPSTGWFSTKDLLYKIALKSGHVNEVWKQVWAGLAPPKVEVFV